MLNRSQISDDIFFISCFCSTLSVLASSKCSSSCCKIASFAAVAAAALSSFHPGFSRKSTQFRKKLVRNCVV